MYVEKEWKMEEMTREPHEEDAGPSTYVRGYHRLPQENLLASELRDKIPHEPYPGIVPPPYSEFCAPQSSSYTPAPQNFNFQQHNSNNVVVVNQPASQPAVVVEEEVNTPNDHLLFTICTLIFCCLLGNWIALICLIPALCLSLAANNANSNRNYVSAKRSADISLCCSICVYIQFLTVLVIGAIFLAVMFTMGLGFIGVDARFNV